MHLWAYFNIFETGKEIFLYSSVNFPNTPNSQSWAKLKPGAWLCATHPRGRAIFHYLPRGSLA